nr:hypothetical protein [Tanacetum cinerariifolium]
MAAYGWKARTSLRRAANKEEPVRRGPEAESPGSTLRRSSQNSISDMVLDHVILDLCYTSSASNANMAFNLPSTEDVLPWPGNANMVFDLRLTEDV